MQFLHVDNEYSDETPRRRCEYWLVPLLGAYIRTYIVRFPMLLLSLKSTDLHYVFSCWCSVWSQQTYIDLMQFDKLRAKSKRHLHFDKSTKYVSWHYFLCADLWKQAFTHVFNVSMTSLDPANIHLQNNVVSTSLRRRNDVITTLGVYCGTVTKVYEFRGFYRSINLKKSVLVFLLFVGYLPAFTQR